MFGPHLILEGYDCQKKENLGQELSILTLLSQLPVKLKMQIILPPKIIHYDGGQIPEDAGISGFVIIAESHVSIHTFPQKRFFTLDIFSCKEFDLQLALDFILELFAPKKYEKHLFNRGKEFPRSVPRASCLVQKEREELEVSEISQYRGNNEES